MPSPSKSLILCVHAHQPVGNFENIFEEAVEKSYRPFFETLEKHPAIPMSCHFSGSLIDWLEKHRPDFIELLRKMNDRGQLEFLGGGYYEPIYGLIPKKDLMGQIQMMTKKLKSLFGAVPRGAWLTERVWDPHLVKTLKSAGIAYTILDDLHFEKVGRKAPVTGYYQARDGKAALDLFASMKQLRYLMPFRKPEETLEFIRSAPAGPQDVFVFADDCEKFGMWPSTYDWVYKEGWLDQFFTLLEKESEISLYTFSRFREKFKPEGSEKIPHSSYSEMMQWSGGDFYNFFKKYPEARYMRDRMLNVSARLTNGAAKEARLALYRAQCNCSYWHGVFGGLYLHHLRSAVFENLIQAEKILKPASAQKIYSEKCGGQTRWRVHQKNLDSFFNPAYGAALEELDHLPRAVNLTCNLQRHKEIYHEAVLIKSAQKASDQPLSIHEMLGSKEKNLENHVFYDAVRRLSFMDHFFESAVEPEAFRKAQYKETGDFIGTQFSARFKKTRGVESLVFERKGCLKLNGKKFSLNLKKTIVPAGPSTLGVRYCLTNAGRTEISFVWGVECNFSIGESQAMKGLDEKNIHEWVFQDSWRGFSIRLDSDAPVSLLTAPVETVSESESGLEKTYQELGVLLQRAIVLKPHKSEEHNFKLSVT